MTQPPNHPAPYSADPSISAGLSLKTQQLLRQMLATIRVAFYVFVWVIFMSIPILFVMMAIVGEFRFQAIGVPKDEVVRIWLVREPKERGFGFSIPSVVDRMDDELYVQTNVNYLLWQGTGESVSYCMGYQRSEREWQQFSISEGKCNP